MRTLSSRFRRVSNKCLSFNSKLPFEVFHPDGRQHLAPTIAMVGADPQGGCTIALKKGIESFGIFFQPTGFLSYSAYR